MVCSESDYSGPTTSRYLRTRTDFYGVDHGPRYWTNCSYDPSRFPTRGTMNEVQKVKTTTSTGEPRTSYKSRGYGEKGDYRHTNRNQNKRNKQKTVRKSPRLRDNRTWDDETYVPNHPISRNRRGTSLTIDVYQGPKSVGTGYVERWIGNWSRGFRTDDLLTRQLTYGDHSILFPTFP